MSEPKFKLGDLVTWTSQAGGKSKTKQGIVIAVISANESPYRAFLRNSEYRLRALAGSLRSHESYLIQVGKSKKLYWPLVKYLKPVEMEPQEDSRHGNLEWILETR